MPRERSGLSLLLAAVGALVLAAALAAVWVRGELLDTERFAATSARVIAQPEVQRATAQFITGELRSAPAVRAALERDVPPRLRALAAPATAAARRSAEQFTVEALQSERFTRAWLAASRLLHAQLLRVIDRPAGTPAVLLDLRPLVALLAERMGFSGRVAASIPEDRGIVEVLSPAEADRLRTAVRLLRAGTWAAVALAVFALLGAALLAPGRAAALRRVGGALVIAGVALAAALLVVRGPLVGGLAQEPAAAAAARATWSALTARLGDFATWSIVAGLALAVGGWLGGRRRPAR